MHADMAVLSFCRILTPCTAKSTIVAWLHSHINCEAEKQIIAFSMLVDNEG
jgi:hypothetical protein